MKEWFELAVSHPWPFIALAIMFGVWKVGRELVGYIANYIDEIKNDSRDMKSAIVSMGKLNVDNLDGLKREVAQGFLDNRQAVESLERQIVRAIQAKPDDKELFAVLFEHNPVAISYVGPDHKFIRVNRSCEELLGYSAGELANMTFTEITAAQDLQADLDNVESLKAGVFSRYRMQKHYIRKDGTTIECALHVFRYPDSGNFLHFISIIIPLK